MAGIAQSCAVAEIGASPSSFSRIVIVIEENESLQAVLGAGKAPFLDALAAGRVKFTCMLGWTQPSQPNYLQWFPRSYQGSTRMFSLTPLRWAS